MAVKRVLPVVVRLGTLFFLICFVACSGSGGGGGETSGSRAQLTAINIDPVNPSIANGTTVQLTATGIYSNKTTKDLTTMVNWSSADSTIAQVSNTSGSNGLATAASIGQTAISAQLGTIQGSTRLTATAATLTSVDIEPESATIAKGTQVQLQALGTFSESSTAFP